MRDAVVGSRSKEPHSVGKVLSDKMVRAEALEAALGRIWGVFGSDPGANLPVTGLVGVLST